MKNYFLIYIIMVCSLSTYGLIGDINRDGIVDGYDLISLARSFGSMDGNESFNPFADLTGNQRVDGEDLALLASNFGRRDWGNTSFELIVNSSSISDIEPLTSLLTSYGNASAIQRYKEIELNPKISNIDSIRLKDTIYLNLFEDKEYISYIDRVHTYINGTLAIRARIQNYDYSYFIIVTTENKSIAVIDLPEREEYYMIYSDTFKENHFLFKKDRNLMDAVENHPPLLPPSGDTYDNLFQDEENVIKAGPYEHADIDIMVIYTPRAKQWAEYSSGIGIENIMALAMEKAQLAFDNSNIIASANLVFSSEVDYQESNNYIVDLLRLTASEDFNPGEPVYEGHDIEGYMEEIHQWRDMSGADLVVLLAHLGNFGGAAWLLDDLRGIPELGFSITNIRKAAHTYTFIHEIGHNMGAHHHKDQNFQPGPGLFDYSAGWRWTGSDGGRYCSLMTYGCGSYFPDGITHIEVNYFSNPDITHFGVPTGHPQHGDNARTLRKSKHIIAAYRTAEGNPPKAPTNLIGDAISPEEVRLEWTINSANELGFAIEKRLEGEDHFREIARSEPGASQYILEADPKVKNYFRIRAFNRHGYSSYSNIVKISIGIGW